MGRPEYNDSITSDSGDDAASNGETYLGTVYFGGQRAGTPDIRNRRPEYPARRATGERQWDDVLTTTIPPKAGMKVPRPRATISVGTRQASLRERCSPEMFSRPDAPTNLISSSAPRPPRRSAHHGHCARRDEVG